MARSASTSFGWPTLWRRPCITAGIRGSSMYKRWVKVRLCCVKFFFFFQAEDGIRDLIVTGVQTCALPIYQLGQFGWSAVGRLSGRDVDPVISPSASTRELGHRHDLDRPDAEIGQAFEIQIGRASCRERV